LPAAFWFLLANLSVQDSRAIAKDYSLEFRYCVFNTLFSAQHYIQNPFYGSTDNNEGQKSWGLEIIAWFTAIKSY
jgi:hypothetical protein